MRPRQKRLIALPALFATLTLTAVGPARAEQSDAPLTRADRARMVEELLDQEPSSGEVIRQAMSYFELHPDDIARFRRTLRSKAAAPYFVVSERLQDNGFDRDLGFTSTLGVLIRRSTDALAARRSSTTGILSWDIPVGVMTDAEFQTYQLALVQRQIISTVNVWLYSRRMLMIELLIDPPSDPRAYTSLRLRFDGFTALLDTYTGGWYGRQLPEIPEALRRRSAGVQPGG